MTKQVQIRRGTDVQHPFFTGAEGEISVNTTNKSIHVHDGNTPGGVEAARADLGNVDAALVSWQDLYLSGGLRGDTLTFSNLAGSEAMRINSNSHVLVAKTSTGTILSSGMELSPNYCMFSASNTGSSPTMYVGVNGVSGGLISFYKSGVFTGAITTDGSSTTYATSSDYRLKTDAQPMTGASARVQALKPVNFEWIAEGTRVDGFLAHEAQAVVPECVTGTKDAMMDEEYEVTPAVYEDIIIPAVEAEAERTEQKLVTEAVMGTRSVPDYQGIDQSKLVPLLTAALQEALTKIDDLETRLTTLEGSSHDSKIMGRV